MPCGRKTVTSESSDYEAGGFVGYYTDGTFTGCSFDSEKNSGLAAAGTGDISAGVEGVDGSTVLGNICEDYYGGHQYENGECIRCHAKDPNYNPPAPPSITYYDITAAQPEHGTITLSTDRIYRYGDVDVTLTAEEGYEVKDLLINGKSVGAVSSYTIEDVTEDIHITAVFGETEEAKNDRIAKGVQNTTIRMYYKKGEIGKGWIKLRFKKSYGYKVDNYEIFRSAKKKTNFGEKPWFVTKTNKTSGYYKNGKSVKKGTRYYYKMHGVREIAGETYYTQWSNVVMRTGR